MTIKEALDELILLGVAPYDISKALGVPNAQIHRLRRVKSARPPAPDVWKPALYRLARERALLLESVALRLTL